ncbi:nucleotide sugar dehydrogenase [Halosegnis longus]|uniref:Nucleotide sugar dehydrogenase n=1 Tax=Halosegnis longus TaxID=2216012 RepID=A0AAJ4R9K2_9EURY|nr:nucleotide sugar dehydrogenase [Salella cibi]
MHVSVIGSGYVGATLTGCLAALGHEVTAIDIDESVVASIEAGEPPMAEPGLDSLYAENADRISATTDYAAVRDTGCSFITVQTPAREDGSIDPSVVLAAAESLGEALAQKETFHTVAVKSTVIPGMVEEEVVPRIEQAAGPEGETFATAVNPEFQAQGSAVDDFMHPDKVVLGTDDDRALDALRAVYAPLPDEPPVVETGRREAAMMKYANNVFLAAKVSLINELGNICKEYGVDSYEVAEAMGLDDRIGAQFLRSGVGWGGSCLTGDQRLLIRTADKTELITFEQFHERFVDGETVRDVTVLSHDGDGFEFKPVTGATKRQYTGPLHTIETSMSKSVTVTHDHPMLVASDGGTAVVEAQNLTEGDRLPTLDSMPANPVGQFDLIEFVADAARFDNERVYLKPNFELETVKDELRDVLEAYNRNHSYDRVHEFIRNNYIPLDVFLEFESSLPLTRAAVSLYTTRGGGQTYVPGIIDADESFWRFIGYYLSEGHIHDDSSGHGSTPRRRLFISFHPSDEPELVADVETYFEDIGIRYRTDTQETSTQIEVSSRVFAAFIESLGCGTGSYSAAVPDIAHDETATHKRALLAGLFRGDGHINYTNHSNAVVYDYGSVSEELIQGMQFLLHSLGIVPSYKQSESEKSTQPAHFLRVSSKAQIAALTELFQPEEQAKIENRLEQYEREIAPIGYTDGGTLSVNVNEISTQQTETEVYSIEVADNSTFVTTDGLVVHNCFPKDTDALRAAARDRDYEPELLDAVVGVNETQPRRLLELLDRHVDVAGERVAVLGLAFKPDTDDIRGSRAKPVIAGLQERGAEVAAYDPSDASETMARAYPDVEYTDSASGALDGAVGALVVTDWPAFGALDGEFDAMARQVVVDGRRIIEARKGMTYEGLTW